MAETKNLCAQIDLALHTKVSEEKEKAGQTTSQYITRLSQEIQAKSFTEKRSFFEARGLAAARWRYPLYRSARFASRVL